MSKGEGAGRPKLEIEDIEFNGWDMLDALIIWSNADYCAERLKISVDTLGRRIKERHGVDFAEYKEQKKEGMRVNIRKKQYDVAMAGNVSMLIWLGKNELGQSDKQELSAKADQIKLVIEGLNDPIN
jgi:hypothetical protein